jgi:hypothetical protein
MTPPTVAERFAARHVPRPRPTPSRPAAGELWHVWPGRNRPSSAIEEERFVERLRELAGPAATHRSSGDVDRSDVTALLNALRCALDVDDLLGRAPGLAPVQLLRAHERLDELRVGSVLAWTTIVADPTPATVRRQAGEAGKLVPVLVDRLVALAASDPAALPGAVAGAAGEIRRVGRVALAVEDWMSEPSMVGGRADEAGRLLYDLAEPGLWSHAAYLPARVGSLVPVRVAALLGERRG